MLAFSLVSSTNNNSKSKDDNNNNSLGMGPWAITDSPLGTLDCRPSPGDHSAKSLWPICCPLANVKYTGLVTAAWVLVFQTEITSLVTLGEHDWWKPER